jgi:hypothetical protein
MRQPETFARHGYAITWLALQAQKKPKPANLKPHSRELIEEILWWHNLFGNEVTMEDLVGPIRHRGVVQARSDCMRRIRSRLGWSFPRIGKLFGNRDHTTVMHADRKIRTLMAERRSLYNQVSDLTSRIRSQPRVV